MKGLGAKVFRLLASLKLAVVVMVLLAVSLATATVIESLTDTATAQYYVYRSRPFALLLAMLGVNIFCVAMSRYPWREKHAPFLFAHAGILILLGGSWVTQRFGIDGNIRVTEGQTASIVDLEDAVLAVTEGDTFKTIPVQWLPPGVKFKPIDLVSHGLPYDIRVDQFLSHADADISFVARTRESPATRPGAAVKVRLKGGPMRITQEYWLWSGSPGWSQLEAGPAVLRLGEGQGPAPAGRPVFTVAALPDGGLRYEAISSAGKKVGGKLTAAKASGHVIDPGWKGNVEISVLQWLPDAVPLTKYLPSKVEYGTQAPPSAIHVVAGTEDVWMGLGDRAVFRVSGRDVELGYYPKRVVLPFSVKLERFSIERYEGTADPASYSSQVRVLGGFKAPEKVTTISMNEPLDYAGFTLYQASYEDAQPRPVVSIFSVNRDPGRAAKYIGSLLIVFGSIALFAMKYVKKKREA